MKNNKKPIHLREQFYGNLYDQFTDPLYSKFGSSLIHPQLEDVLVYLDYSVYYQINYQLKKDLRDFFILGPK